MEELARSIQSTALSEALAGSIWAFPLVAAFHVLAVAWFGGATLVSILQPRNPEVAPRTSLLWGAAIFTFVTGVLLCIAEPHRALASPFLRWKLVFLVALTVLIYIGKRLPRGLSIGVKILLWTGVILASRGIAFL